MPPTSASPPALSGRSASSVSCFASPLRYGRCRRRFRAWDATPHAPSRPTGGRLLAFYAPDLSTLTHPQPQRSHGSHPGAGDALLLALPPFPHGLFRSLASNASSGLKPTVRYRPFRRIAPALTVFVGLGSPARTAYAVGSSLPTTARPTSSGSLPATDNGRVRAGSARRRDSLRLPPPPWRARMPPALNYKKKSVRHQLRRFLTTSLTPFHYAWLRHGYRHRRVHRSPTRATAMTSIMTIVLIYFHNES